MSHEKQLMINLGNLKKLDFTLMFSASEEKLKDMTNNFTRAGQISLKALAFFNNHIQIRIEKFQQLQANSVYF